MSGPRIHDAFAYLTSSIYTQLAGLISILAAMHLLKIEEFGFYSYLVATTTIFCFVLDGAVSQGMIRIIGKKSNAKLRCYTEFQQFQIIGCTVIAFILLLVINSESTEKSTAMLYFSIGSILTSLVTPVFSYHIALGNKWASIRKDTLITTIRIALIILFYYKYSTLEFLSSINIFCGLAALAYGIRLAPTRKYNFKLAILTFAKFKSILKSIGSLFILMGASIVYNKIDIVILKSLSNDSEVAKYAGAVQFVYPLMFISSAIMTGIYPVLAKESLNKEKQFNTVFKIMIAMAGISIGLVLALSLLSNTLFTNSFHGKYAQSKEIFSVVIWYILIVFTYGPMSNALIANEKTWVLSKITMFAASICIILNIIGIHYLGALGAASAKILCELILIVMVAKAYLTSKTEISNARLNY